MPLRRLIASGLLLAVLVAPALGFALCNVAPAPAKSGCARCAEMEQHTDSAAAQHQPSQQLPVAPCCQRKVPTPALGESAAQVVAPVQIALLCSPSLVAALPALPARHLKPASAPPPHESPLTRLCTLRI